jgi:hypothetical protein
VGEKGMKIRFLQLGLLLLLAVGLIAFAVLAHSETDIYVTAKSEGMGYEPGVGLSVSHLYRSGYWGFKGFGDVSNQKKNNADSGYTYSLNAQARLYPGGYDAQNFWGQWYVAGGYGVSGYESEFEDSTWKKDIWWPHLEAGFDSQNFDAYLRYYPKETQTENEVEAVKLGASLLLTKHWLIMAEITQSWFDQSGGRDNDQILLIGTGWRF